MKILLSSFTFIFLILSCSSGSVKKSSLNDQTSLYSYQDASGSFLLQRQRKLKNGKFVVRTQLYTTNISEEPLEKTISISQMGSVKKNPVMKPIITQHTVWFDKKRYFVQHKTNDSKKALDSIYDSPESKWKGKTSRAFPMGRVFCYFSQLPECLSYYGLLRVNDKKTYDFVIIFDGYPYVLEQLSNMPDSVFIKCLISYDDEFGGNHRFSVDLGNQNISYHFNKKMEFEKMFWIAQSVSMIKQN